MNRSVAPKGDKIVLARVNIETDNFNDDGVYKPADMGQPKMIVECKVVAKGPEANNVQVGDHVVINLTSCIDLIDLGFENTLVTEAEAIIAGLEG
jgi:hypothetical protein